MIMNKKQQEQTVKQPYIAPQCEVIPVEQTAFICTSVTVENSTSTEDDYDDMGDQEGGEHEVDLGF